MHPIKNLNWKFIGKRFLLSLITALLFGLLLLYDWYADNFKVSHAVLVGLIFILGMLVVHVNKIRDWWRRAIEFVGLETTGVLRLQISVFGALLLSIYLLLSDAVAVIPTVLQFSIIPITAVLGGLVIAGANYSKITPESRSELLNVAQNLIVATIAFIFFAVVFFAANIGSKFDPNQIPTTQLEWIKLVLYWFALLSFLLGTVLFVIGIINLAIGLNKLKKPKSK